MCWRGAGVVELAALENGMEQQSIGVQNPLYSAKIKKPGCRPGLIVASRRPEFCAGAETLVQRNSRNRQRA